MTIQEVLDSPEIFQGVRGVLIKLETRLNSFRVSNGPKLKSHPAIRLSEKGYLTTKNLIQEFCIINMKGSKLPAEERTYIEQLVYPVVVREETRLKHLKSLGVIDPGVKSEDKKPAPKKRPPRKKVITPKTK